MTHIFIIRECDKRETGKCGRKNEKIRDLFGDFGCGMFFILREGIRRKK